MKVGYARVSSTGQNLESQIEALEKAECEKIFTEKKSGKQANNRTELQNALDFVRDGDIFLVTRLDRCSRSVADLHSILNTLNKKGVSFKATEQELDTSTSTGRLMIGLLSIVSAFETDLRAERQADGIKSALKRGVRFGRSSKLTDIQVEEITALQEQGNLTNQQIADMFEIGRSTLLRYVANYKKSIENLN
jgi:DNA invertase Pin-like site-specific DNA recombinase